MRKSLSLAVVLMLALSHAVSAQEAFQSPAAGEIRADNCMVRYISKVNIPAKAEGILMDIKVDEGNTVSKGDIVAVIDNTASALAIQLKKAEYKEAMITADNDVNLRDAANSEQLASAEAEAFADLRREGAIPRWELEKKVLEAKRMKLRIELAEMQNKIDNVKMIAKRSELEIAEFELSRREITAPSTGFVESRIAQLGEWVQPGSPLVTLIQMDKLRIEGDIDGLRYRDQARQGTPVEIVIYTGAKDDMRINGKLGYVSMEMDLNNKHRVWVEIDNKKVGDNWLFKPGMRAEIIIRKANEVF